MRIVCFVMTVTLAGLFGGQAFAQQVDCNADLKAMFDAREKTGKEVKAASERKASQPEMCQAIRRYAATEEKLAKYVVENRDWCQVPAQFLTQIKSAVENTRKIRTQICSAQQRPAGPPPGAGIGSLSGPSAVARPTQRPSNPLTQGSGVFSTLGGQ